MHASPMASWELTMWEAELLLRAALEPPLPEGPLFLAAAAISIDPRGHSCQVNPMFPALDNPEGGALARPGPPPGCGPRGFPGSGPAPASLPQTQAAASCQPGARG